MLEIAQVSSLSSLSQTKLVTCRFSADISVSGVSAHNQEPEALSRPTGGTAMFKRHLWLPVVFLFFSLAQPAAAEHRFIVRTTLGLSGLKLTCLLHACTVVRS